MADKVLMDGGQRRGAAGTRKLRAPLLFSTAMVALAIVSIGGSALAASPHGTSNAHVIYFSGHLNGSQVVGGTSSHATGTAVVRIDTVAQTITTDLKWTGLSGPADRSHIHSGDPGTPTDDKFFHEVLSPQARTVPCGWDSATFPECVPTTGSSHDVLDVANDYIPDPGACPDMQCIVDTAIPNGFFIDMHDQLYPGGEIRGQLTVVPRRADARVRLGKSGSYLGNNVYNTTGRHQSVSGAAPAGGSVTYQVSIQNDAKAFRDRFTVSVSGVTAVGHHVRYRTSAGDITTGVDAGTYTTSAIADGGKTLITVIVHFGHGAAFGSKSELLVTVTSVKDPDVSDTVRIIARRK